MNRQSDRRRTPAASTVIAGVLISLLGLLTAVAAVTVFQLPDAITEQGERTTVLYQATLAISFLVFFGVTAGIIWAVFRYRRRSPDEMPEQIHGSSVLELTWTIIPVIILVSLFIPSLIMVIDLKTPPAAAETDLTVEAVGHQWWWEFVYPDQGVRVQSTPPDYEDLEPPRLVVPVGKTVVVKVRSTDVIHSFYVPNLLYKIQAIPGNVNQMHFKAEKVGVYTGQCYQFCGLRHSDMLFILDVREEDDYERWLADMKQAQAAPEPTSTESEEASGLR